MKTILLRTKIIAFALFLLTLTARAQGNVNVYIGEENLDPATNTGVPYTSAFTSHCPGVPVNYAVSTDHYDVFKIRVYVTNGVITDYTHTSNSQLISSTEVLLQPDNGAMGPTDAHLQVTWNNGASASGNLHAVAYYHYFGFLFTQQAETYSNVTLTPGLPATPTQATYYACAGTSFPISFVLPPAATSSNWSLPDAAWRVNGGQGVIGQSSYNVGGVTTVTISVPPGVAPGFYQIHTSSAGPCSTLGYRSIPVVIGSPPTQVDGETQANWTYTYTYSVPNTFGSGYTWMVPSGWTIVSGQGTASIRARSPKFDVTGNVTVAFTDQCGGPATAATTVDNTQFQCRCLPQKASPVLVEAVPVEVYPNPVADQLNISPGKPGPFTVTVRNNQGTVVEMLRGDGTGQFNTTTWEPGLYQLDITDATGTVTKRRLAK